MVTTCDATVTENERTEERMMTTDRKRKRKRCGQVTISSNSPYEAAGLCLEAPEAPSRRQEVKQRSRVRSSFIQLSPSAAGPFGPSRSRTRLWYSWSGCSQSHRGRTSAGCLQTGSSSVVSSGRSQAGWTCRWSLTGPQIVDPQELEPDAPFMGSCFLPPAPVFG